MLTAEMLQHLGGYLLRNYGDRYYVERFEPHRIGMGFLAFCVCAIDGARFTLLVEPVAGCRWEDSTVGEFDPAAVG